MHGSPQRNSGSTAASLALAGLVGLLPARGHAHGGLPATTQLQWHGSTMYVTADYWGLFVRDGSGPWRWICDEALNSNQQRTVALGGDGTLYATNLTGISISSDAGCSWNPAAGDLGTRTSAIIASDPVLSTRVFVAASQGDQSELWRSDDSGQTWSIQSTFPKAWLSGMAVSEDGKAVYLVAISGVTSPSPDPRLYTSTDAGRTFDSASIAPLPTDVSAVRVTLLALDNRDPGAVYVGSQAGARAVLLRAKPAVGSVTEVLRVDSIIKSVAVDRANDRLLVGTTAGVYHADGDQPLTLSPSLSYAPCVAAHDGKVYACSNTYAPNNADVASSMDDAQSFTKLFMFSDTDSIVPCAKGTPVAKLCPDAWMTYGYLLGLKPLTSIPGDLGSTMSADMAVNLPSDGAGPPSCSCDVGARPPGANALNAGIWLVLVSALLHRRRTHVLPLDFRHSAEAGRLVLSAAQYRKRVRVMGRAR